MMATPFHSVMAAEGRRNNFDFLRFVLATGVVFFHSYVLPAGTDADEPISRLTHGQISGATAVFGFFLISGFLVTKSWQGSRDAGDYLRKRVLRLYPAFVVVSLFCALIAGPLGADNVGEYFRHLSPLKFVAYMLLLVGPYLPPVFLHLPLPNAVDGSFWTLRYEFECYLLIALLGVAGLLARRSVVLIVFVALLALHVVQNHAPHPILPDRDWHLLGNPARWSELIVYFFAGSVFYLYRERIGYSRLLAMICLVLLAALCLFSQALDVVFPLLGAYLLFFVAYSPRLRFQNFGKYGDFSYGVYLYSFPIQQLLIQYAGRNLHPLVLFAVSLVITVCLAALSWHWVEKPCLRLKRAA